jgi:glycosyltransferase involved in cell wall biosynthesis
MVGGETVVSLENTPNERPLVTFAVFAYNQEQYIREAIEGAFAQTYEPLEIILSDDCSADRTFEIMQEMAAGYEGPHKVRVRRTRRNGGTFNHILEVVDESDGALLVVGAGDDVSYPCRVDSVCDEWRKTGAYGLYSRYDLIDERGDLLRRGERGRGGVEIRRWFSSNGDVEFIHGATSAYDIRLFSGLRRSEFAIYSEDAVFSFLLHLSGLQIAFVDTPLVGYRQHSTSWSTAKTSQKSMEDVQAFERKLSFAADGYMTLCDYCRMICEERGSSSDYFLMRQIVATHRYARLRASWIHCNFVQRLGLVVACRETREFRYLLPRLIGLSAFSLVKAAFNRRFRAA